MQNKIQVEVMTDVVLKVYVAQMLHRIAFYPKPMRNFTLDEVEKRIAKRFGVKL